MDYTKSGKGIFTLNDLQELEDEELLNLCLTNSYVNQFCKQDDFWKLQSVSLMHA